MVGNRSEQSGLRAGSFTIESINEVVVVFPLVPVTADQLQRIRGMPKEIRRRNSESLAAFAHLNPRHVVRATCSGSRADSLAIAIAPRAIASSNKGVAIFFGPVQRKKHDPGCGLA